MQAGSMHLSEGTADRQRPLITPTNPNRVSAGPVTEACIHGQWLAGTGPSCHCLHEEAGAPQVSTAQVTGLHRSAVLLAAADHSIIAHWQ